MVIQAYPDRPTNELYNLLFADDVSAFERALGGADPAALAADADAESRVRAVAFRRLKAAGVEPPAKPPLLGVIVEIALDQGLDALAAYADGRVRYINHAGGISIVEGDSPLRGQVEALLLAARPAIASIGPWERDRLPPPPRGQARLTFLVGGELYFGQGPFTALAADPQAGPILLTATTLLLALGAAMQPRPKPQT